MNYLNRVRRADAAANIGLAAGARRNAIKVAFSPEFKASFIAEAKALLRWAASDRRFAADAGWKLP